MCNTLIESTFYVFAICVNISQTKGHEKFRFRGDVDKNMQITVMCKSHHESENLPPLRLVL